MKIKATVLDSTYNNKIIQIEVNPKVINQVMKMLTKGGFEVDYRKVNK